MLLDEAEELAHPRSQAPFGIGLGCVALQALEQLLARALDVGDVEPLFRAEVGVEHGLGDPGQPRDVVHGRGVIAVLGEDLPRDVEDQPLALGARHAPRSGLTRFRCVICR